ncbi:MAG: S-methyl-5'-thioinosine phosphorylase [Pseudomonadales bacterium]
MTTLGVFVGGSPLPSAGQVVEAERDTPWGEVSDLPYRVQLGEVQLLLMHRHGPQRELSPHQINYRANVWLMQQLGATVLIGTHTVGSIDPNLKVGELVLPEQLIDYTWGRAQTFDDQRRHVDFSSPYSADLRARILASGVPIHAGGVYACTQGPRLESAAEIVRLARDGCTIVGMTGMPEAGLARELELEFASLCVVVNPAAGVSSASIDMQALREASERGAAQIWAVLTALGAT